MSVSFTLTRKTPLGEGRYMSYGTFTSAALDTSGTLSLSVHGINTIEQVEIDLGNQAAEPPTYSVSGTTITVTTADFAGLSGTWKVIGL